MRGRGRSLLDRDRLVKVALDLLDEVGFDGLTMRRLADRLDVKAASLYWHVRNKEELLGLLADEICAGVGEPDPSSHWRAQLEMLARENRRVLLAHRDAARLLSGVSLMGANRLRLAEITLRALLGAGFSEKESAYASILLTDYATGFVKEEVTIMNTARSRGVSSEEALAEVRDQFETLRAEEFPSVVRLAASLTDVDVEERFEFGLNVLLDGLGKRLPK